jgi:hypothetical protein
VEAFRSTNQTHPTTMFSWIVLILSIALLLFAVGAGMKTHSWVKDAQSVEGTVVELVEKRKKKKKGGTRLTYAPRVSYVINGETKEFVSSQSSNPPDFKTGDTVRVAVNPAKDKECIATFGELYGFPVVGSCLGGALALGVLVIMNGDKVLRIMHPNLNG